MRINRVGRHPLTVVNTAGFTVTGVLKRSDFGLRLGLPAVGDDVSFQLVLMGRNLD